MDKYNYKMSEQLLRNTVERQRLIAQRKQTVCTALHPGDYKDDNPSAFSYLPERCIPRRPRNRSAAAATRTTAAAASSGRRPPTTHTSAPSVRRRTASTPPSSAPIAPSAPAPSTSSRRRDVLLAAEYSALERLTLAHPITPFKKFNPAAVSDVVQGDLEEFRSVVKKNTYGQFVMENFPRMISPDLVRRVPDPERRVQHLLATWNQGILLTTGWKAFGDMAKNRLYHLAYTHYHAWIGG